MFLSFLSSKTHLFISVRHFLLLAQRRQGEPWEAPVSAVSLQL